MTRFNTALFAAALTSVFCVGLSSSAASTAVDDGGSLSTPAGSTDPAPLCSNSGVCKSDDDCCSSSDCRCSKPNAPCYCQMKK